MKELNPRITCADGISLSVQANQYAYCSPRIDEIDHWCFYTAVEVGFIEDKDGNQFTPPDDWEQYGEYGLPSDVYGYIPTQMVEKFINDHGGNILVANSKCPPPN